MSKEISVNDSDVREIQGKFDDLESKKQKKVIKSTLTSSANILRKETRRQLGAKRGRPRKNLVQGVRMRAIVTDNTKRAVVHIMGDYRLKWLELGTAPRYNTYKRRRHLKNWRRAKKLHISNYSERAWKRCWIDKKPSPEFTKDPLKKKRYTGQVTPTRFFMKAQAASQDKIFKEMQSRMADNILKIWEK